MLKLSREENRSWILKISIHFLAHSQLLSQSTSAAESDSDPSAAFIDPVQATAKSFETSLSRPLSFEPYCTSQSDSDVRNN